MGSKLRERDSEGGLGGDDLFSEAPRTPCPPGRPAGPPIEGAARCRTSGGCAGTPSPPPPAKAERKKEREREREGGREGGKDGGLVIRRPPNPQGSLRRRALSFCASARARTCDTPLLSPVTPASPPLPSHYYKPDTQNISVFLNFSYFLRITVARPFIRSECQNIITIGASRL